MDLNGHFKGLLHDLEPDAAHVSKAKSAHERLRKRIRENPELGAAHIDTYLSGSYARRVAINNIKDVDVICVVDIDTSVTEPDVVIAWLASALQESYANVREQGRSVQVIDSNDVHLDVVPGSPYTNEDGPLWIPDREAREWVSTHPKGQLAFCIANNSNTGDFYVPLVKLIKWWRDRCLAKAVAPKSYVLETLVAEGLGSRSPSSYGAGIVQVLEGVSSRYLSWVGTGQVPWIADPGFPSINVAKRWESEEFDGFMAAVDEWAAVARAAYEAQTESESVSLWRKLFGADFSL